MSKISGCMKVTAKTLMEDGLNAVYHGEWKNPIKRQQFLSKPRKYIINMYLIDNSGDKDITTLKPKEKLNTTQLSEVIHKFLNELIDTYKERGLNLSLTFITIKAG